MFFYFSTPSFLETKVYKYSFLFSYSYFGREKTAALLEPLKWYETQVTGGSQWRRER